MIGILNGSSRPHSNTARVGKAIRRILMQHGISSDDILMPDFSAYDIPFSNGGHIHPGHLSPFQQEVYDTFDKSRLIFVLSPEYNWFPSAEIINLIHQYGTRDMKHCWDGKIFATCGISSGRGGRIPAVQMSYVINKLINVMDLHSIVSAKMFESQFTTKTLGPEGESLGNAEYDAGLEKFVSYNLNMLQKISPGISG